MNSTFVSTDNGDSRDGVSFSVLLKNLLNPFNV